MAGKKQSLESLQKEIQVTQRRLQSNKEILEKAKANLLQIKRRMAGAKKLVQEATQAKDALRQDDTAVSLSEWNDICQTISWGQSLQETLAGEIEALESHISFMIDTVAEGEADLLKLEGDLATRGVVIAFKDDNGRNEEKN